jgi:hypothetical protein
MLNGGARFAVTEDPGFRDRSRSISAMASLFAPLDHLLGGGGDPRIGVDPVSGLNEYGCQLAPCPDTLSFASSTATSISARAYARASRARDELMQSAIAIGVEAAFDARLEAMRGELRVCLGLLPERADIVFSPSGTDAQLQALLLTRALLGPALTSIVVAADQTGSGTEHTARGHHFNAVTANGSPVRKGEPLAGLTRAIESVALGLFTEGGEFRNDTETDALVLGAVEASISNGNHVLLQIMDSSKLGRRAPSDRCLDEIAARWPERVQIVVDACQMRLGRPRLRKYLDRGYLVIVTGSKFFTGPAFSGALLVPASLASAIDGIAEIATGFRDYFSRSDWPRHWQNLRSRFPVRENFGQWLRWEAALEEIRAYHRVPDAFRRSTLAMFGEGVEQIIASTPSLSLLPPQHRPEHLGFEDEELAQPTIFPFVIRHGSRALPLAECRKIYRALARDGQDGVGVSSLDPRIKPKPCLVGQPVALGRGGPDPVAVLRICAGARLVTETWSSDADAARRNLQRQLADVGAVVSRIEWLVAHLDDQN